MIPDIMTFTGLFIINILILYIVKSSAKNTIIQKSSKENLPRFLEEYKKSCRFVIAINTIIWLIIILIVMIFHGVL